MRGAIGRRIALGSDARRQLLALEEELIALQTAPDNHHEEIAEVEAAIAVLRARIGRIPYLDPIHLRYRSRVRVPVPTAKAVMFCLMDVSGSMDESRKDLAKRFFILLYLFLTCTTNASTSCSSVTTRRLRRWTSKISSTPRRPVARSCRARWC